MSALTPEDELFRARMHFNGPEGFEPCSRPWPHAGPCAHAPRPPLQFVLDYTDWQERRSAAWRRYEEALPCLTSMCGYRVEVCRNCRLVDEAATAIAGPPPHPGDYREDDPDGGAP